MASFVDAAAAGSSSEEEVARSSSEEEVARSSSEEEEAGFLYGAIGTRYRAEL